MEIITIEHVVKGAPKYHCYFLLPNDDTIYYAIILLLSDTVHIIGSAFFKDSQERSHQLNKDEVLKIWDEVLAHPFFRVRNITSSLQLSFRE